MSGPLEIESALDGTVTNAGVPRYSALPSDHLDHVTAEQLKALNAGELGVVQANGRYVLVTAAVLAEAKAIFAEAIALEVDPNAPPPADDYSDPRFQVPDDLVW